MEAKVGLFIATQLFSLIALFCWSYFFRIKDSRVIVLKWAAILIAAPFFVIFFLNRAQISLASLPIILLIGEELYKLALSRFFRNPLRSLALVSLFGVFEAIILKSYIPFVQSDAFSSYWLDNIVFLYLMIASSMLMHACTGIIYAARTFNNPIIQIFIGISIHLTYNELTIFSISANDNSSLATYFIIFLFFIVALLFYALWLVHKKKFELESSEISAPLP